ncbi:putative pyridoxal 5'-phosphate synthase subunit PDX2 [Drosera capensis]
MAVVGVLALQGSFNEHIAALRRIGVKGLEIRKAEQLDCVSGLIIPGGESTTMAKLAEYHNMFPALREFVKMGRPVWGTCAGLIFLANKAIQSFEADLSVPELAAKEGGSSNFRGVFIRAPAILEAGPEVDVLAEVVIQSKESTKSSSNSVKTDPESDKKVIVAVKQGNLHRYFLKMVDELSEGTTASGIVIAGGDSTAVQEQKIDLPVFVL